MTAAEMERLHGSHGAEVATRHQGGHDYHPAHHVVAPWAVVAKPAVAS